MGDRAIVVFRDADSVSPGVYLHWDGYRAYDLLRAAAPRMRKGDAGYSAARFAGVCHEHIAGNLSLGLLPPPRGTTPDLLADYSHGDAGVFLVDVDTGDITCYGGYGWYDENGASRKPPGLNLSD